MERHVLNSCIIKLAYSGAAADHLLHYVDIALQGHPESVLIHGGTNDCYGRNSSNKSASEVANKVILIDKKCRKLHGTKTIFIS